MQLILFVFIFLLILFQFYRRKKHNYWEKLGVPSPPTHFLFGTIKSFILEKKSLEDIFHHVRNMYPNERFVGIYLFFKPILLINDPELITRVLVKDSDHFLDRYTNREDETLLHNAIFVLRESKWKNLRPKLMTATSSSACKCISPLIQYCTELLESQIRWVFFPRLKMFYSTANSKWSSNITVIRVTLAYRVRVEKISGAGSASEERYFGT